MNKLIIGLVGAAFILPQNAAASNSEKLTERCNEIIGKQIQGDINFVKAQYHPAVLESKSAIEEIDKQVGKMLAKINKYGGILRRELLSSESKGPHFTDEKSLFKIGLKQEVIYKITYNKSQVLKQYRCEFATEKGMDRWYLNNVIK